MKVQATSLALLALSVLAAAVPTNLHNRDAPGAEPDKNLRATGSTSHPAGLKLGGNIEGCSVDKNGQTYALNLTHVVSLADGDVAKPLLINTTATSSFASSRWTRTLGFLVADSGEHKVRTKDGSPLFAEPAMLQPNDFTITRDEKHIYLSGMNYTANTGDLWHYDVEKKTANRVDLSGLKTFRTNGIELSNKDDALFLTSAENSANGSSVVGAQIIKLDIDPATGTPSNPAVAFDLIEYLNAKGLDPKGAMDPDGIKMDSNDTLFATLNAFKRVLKWNINSTPCEAEIIDLDTVINPSNLEFGGPEGKTLVVVGRCAKDLATSCVDTFENEFPGRTYTNLQESAPGDDKYGN